MQRAPATSLHLTRKLLCADFEDILYKSTNMARQGPVRDDLPIQVKDELRTMLRFEYDLYNHFLAKLHRQLKKEDIDVRQGLQARMMAHLMEEKKCRKILQKCSKRRCYFCIGINPNTKVIRCKAFISGTIYYFLQKEFQKCVMRRGQKIRNQRKLIK